MSGVAEAGAAEGTTSRNPIAKRAGVAVLRALRVRRNSVRTFVADVLRDMLGSCASARRRSRVRRGDCVTQWNDEAPLEYTPPSVESGARSSRADTPRGSSLEALLPSGGVYVPTLVATASTKGALTFRHPRLRKVGGSFDEG